MSTLMTKMISNNPHCESLKNLFEGQTAKLDWLVIADDDPVLNQRIAEVTDEEAAVVMPIPQDQWQMHSDDLPSAVRWSVSEAGVSNLLVVGSSNANLKTTEATWLGGHGEAQANPSSYNRLLNGSRQVQGQTQRAKLHFSQQVNHLFGDASLQKAMLDGRVQLHLLFYLAMSGAFLSYDLATNRFVPVQ